MEQHHDHFAQDPQHGGMGRPKNENIMPLAINATFHCLLGCGLGEISGMVIGQLLDLAMAPTMVIALSLGFIGGIALGIVPLLRRNFSLPSALKTVILGEGLSIVVMESFELLTQMVVPGVMAAGLTDAIFWLGMAAGLVVGFFAALPVNYAMIRKGIRHVH